MITTQVREIHLFTALLYYLGNEQWLVQIYAHSLPLKGSRQAVVEQEVLLNGEAYVQGCFWRGFCGYQQVWKILIVIIIIPEEPHIF